MKNLIYLARQFCVAFFIFFLVSCAPEYVNVDVCGINYTDKYISAFSINGQGGGNIDPNSGGGSFVCCIRVPRQWHAGMTVKVRWQNDEKNSNLWSEAIVEVPEYKESEIAYLTAHFFSNNTVKVLVTDKTINYPGYPYPRPPKA